MSKDCSTKQDMHCQKLKVEDVASILDRTLGAPPQNHKVMRTRSNACHFEKEIKEVGLKISNLFKLRNKGYVT